MIIHEQNGYLTLEHLSDIELYYSHPRSINGESIILEDEEFHHAVNVMRNSVGDFIYITDGTGNLFKTQIAEVFKKKMIANIIKSTEFKNEAVNIFFCLPILKNSDRMKIAIEKCVELGITNFVLFSSKRTIPQKINTEKFQKTALAAMKQSLRIFLPKIDSASFKELVKLKENKVLFDQHSNRVFDGNMNTDNPLYFLFGPEGGFDKLELDTVSDTNRFCLSTKRLRTETAVIKCASLLNIF